jgi:hypothetical protein
MEIEQTKNFSANEISELLVYVANSGIVVPTETLSPLYAYIHNKGLPVDGEAKNVGSSPMENALSVHEAYTQLTKITSPVTGKTILHSRQYRESVKYIKYTAIFFLLISLFNEMIGMYIGDTSLPDEGIWSYIFNIHLYVITPLSPIFWGGLGSCIFLLKRFSDIASDRTFDADFIGGWQTRVLLGAILGGVIQYIYDPGFIVESGMDENALAFLVGLSVKVFYGALEKLIDAVAEKLNLNAIRRNKTEKNTFSELIVKRIAAGKLSDEQRKALLNLLDDDKA